MLVRVGKISATNPAACTARVTFGDRSDTVSYDLPIIVRGSLQNQDYWMPVPGEQVVCLFLPSGNRGFILGSIYSEVDKPPVTDSNKRLLSFSDGTVLEYDAVTHTLTIDAAEKITITAPKGITLSASDPTGTGVQINGKTNTESW
jgi:phage baseplate assembly protein V